MNYYWAGVGSYPVLILVSVCIVRCPFCIIFDRQWFPARALQLGFHVIETQQLSLMASSSRRRIVSEELDDAASGEHTLRCGVRITLIEEPQSWIINQ